MGQLPVVRRIIAIVAALLFVGAGASAYIHMSGYGLAGLSVMVARPIVCNGVSTQTAHVVHAWSGRRLRDVRPAGV